MLTQDEFYERLNDQLVKEADGPLGWWYLSYADETHFCGGVIVEARGFVGATLAVRLKKISPGGQVCGLPIQPENLPAKKYRNRLLTLEELKEFWPDMEELGLLERDCDDENG